MRVWDAITGQVVLTLPVDTAPVFQVKFSPDGKRIASASRRTVRVWDATTGECIHTLVGHISLVHAVAFSPMGCSSSRAATT